MLFRDIDFKGNLENLTDFEQPGHGIWFQDVLHRSMCGRETRDHASPILCNKTVAMIGALSADLLEGTCE